MSVPRSKGEPSVEELLGIFRLHLHGARPVEPVDPIEGMHCQRVLLELFGDRDALATADMGEILAWKSSQRMKDYNRLHARALATLFADAREWKIIVDEEGSDGTAWRLLERAPMFRKIGGRAVQVRLLPPARQAATDRRLATLGRREATVRANHAARLAPLVADRLGTLAAQGATIPDAWLSFVPADVVRRWPALSDSGGLLLDLHRDWDPVRQREWLAAIDAELARFLRNEHGKADRHQPDDAIDPDDLAALIDAGGP